MNYNNTFNGINTVFQGAEGSGDKVVPATIKLSEQQKEMYRRLAESEGKGLSTWGREAMHLAGLFQPDIRAKISSNAELISLMVSRLK